MAKCLMVVCLLVASALAGIQRQPRIHPSDQWRVVGDKPTDEGDHPHQISLKFSNSLSHYCAGSIVGPNHVITAAHCVVGFPASSFKVVAGTNSLSQGGDFYDVLEIKGHENYDSWTYHNDVAILKVATISFNEKVGAIAVETEDVGGDEPCILTGWKRKFIGGNSDKLAELDLETTTVEYCNRRWRSRPVIDSQICTVTSYGQGACVGDSGGPLIRIVDGSPRLIGVDLSWSNTCGLDYPDGYSRISSFVQWFNDNCENCLNN